MTLYMSVLLIKIPVFLIDAGVEKSRKLLVKGALPTLKFPEKRDMESSTCQKRKENHLLLK